jgi:hypothetical protein
MIIDIKITSFTNVKDFVYDYISYDLHSRVGQWNHTGFFSFICRVVLCYFQTNIIIKLFDTYLITFFEKGLITGLFMFKIFPLTLLGIMMFVVYKKEFEFLGITNKINHKKIAIC